MCANINYNWYDKNNDGDILRDEISDEQIVTLNKEMELEADDLKWKTLIELWELEHDALVHTTLREDTGFLKNMEIQKNYTTYKKHISNMFLDQWPDFVHDYVYTLLLRLPVDQIKQEKIQNKIANISKQIAYFKWTKQDVQSILDVFMNPEILLEGNTASELLKPYWQMNDLKNIDIASAWYQQVAQELEQISICKTEEVEETLTKMKDLYESKITKTSSYRSIKEGYTVIKTTVDPDYKKIEAGEDELLQSVEKDFGESVKLRKKQKEYEITAWMYTIKHALNNFKPWDKTNIQLGVYTLDTILDQFPDHISDLWTVLDLHTVFPDRDRNGDLKGVSLESKKDIRNLIVQQKFSVPAATYLSYTDKTAKIINEIESRKNNKESIGTENEEIILAYKVNNWIENSPALEKIQQDPLISKLWYYSNILLTMYSLEAWDGYVTKGLEQKYLDVQKILVKTITNEKGQKFMSNLTSLNTDLIIPLSDYLKTTSPESPMYKDLKLKLDSLQKFYRDFSSQIAQVTALSSQNSITSDDLLTQLGENGPAFVLALGWAIVVIWSMWTATPLFVVAWASAMAGVAGAELWWLVTEGILSTQWLVVQTPMRKYMTKNAISEERKMSGSEMSKIYSQQVLQWWLMWGIAMGVARQVTAKLAQGLTKNTAWTKTALSVEQVKLSLKDTFGPLTKRLPKSTFGREYTSEMFEEGFGNAVAMAIQNTRWDAKTFDSNDVATMTASIVAELTLSMLLGKSLANMSTITQVWLDIEDTTFTMSFEWSSADAPLRIAQMEEQWFARNDDGSFTKKVWEMTQIMILTETETPYLVRTIDAFRTSYEWNVNTDNAPISLTSDKAERMFWEWSTFMSDNDLIYAANTDLESVLEAGGVIRVRKGIHTLDIVVRAPNPTTAPNTWVRSRRVPQTNRENNYMIPTDIGEWKSKHIIQYDPTTNSFNVINGQRHEVDDIAYNFYLIHGDIGKIRFVFDGEWAVTIDINDAFIAKKEAELLLKRKKEQAKELDTQDKKKINEVVSELDAQDSKPKDKILQDDFASKSVDRQNELIANGKLETKVKIEKLWLTEVCYDKDWNLTEIGTEVTRRIEAAHAIWAWFGSFTDGDFRRKIRMLTIWSEIYQNGRERTDVEKEVDALMTKDIVKEALDEGYCGKKIWEWGNWIVTLEDVTSSTGEIETVAKKQFYDYVETSEIQNIADVYAKIKAAGLPTFSFFEVDIENNTSITEYIPWAFSPFNESPWRDSFQERWLTQSQLNSILEQARDIEKKANQADIYFQDDAYFVVYDQESNTYRVLLGDFDGVRDRRYPTSAATGLDGNLKSFVKEPTIEDKIMNNTNDKMWESLYTSQPFLLKHKDVLWDVTYGDCVWIWWKAIIIRSAKDWAVYKVPIDSDAETLLDKEFVKHDKFLLWISRWKNAGAIPSWINAPVIFEPPSNTWWLFQMEYIKWESLKSKVLKIVYVEEISAYPEDFVNWMSDFHLEKFLVNSLWIDQDDVSLIWAGPAKREVREILWDKRANEFLNTLEYLENVQWMRHDDLHIWNVIIWDDSNVYIIDFDDVVFTN